MHRAFHIERQYVAKNLCPCSGCKEAENLTLKFVAHVGDVATQTRAVLESAGFVFQDPTVESAIRTALAS